MGQGRGHAGPGRETAGDRAQGLRPRCGMDMYWSTWKTERGRASRSGRTARGFFPQDDNPSRKWRQMQAGNRPPELLCPLLPRGEIRTPSARCRACPDGAGSPEACRNLPAEGALLHRWLDEPALRSHLQGGGFRIAEEGKSASCCRPAWRRSSAETNSWLPAPASSTNSGARSEGGG